MAVCTQVVLCVILSRDANSVSKENKLLLSEVLNVLGNKSIRESGFLGILKSRTLHYMGDNLGGD